jgi:hypothetical protein
VAVLAEPITLAQFHEAAGVDNWRILWSVAFAFLRTGDFATSLRLVEQTDGSRRRPATIRISAFRGVGGAAGHQGAQVRNYVLGDGKGLDEDNDAVTEPLQS